jgi:hypothetical protein
MLPDKSSRLFWPSHHCFKPTIPYCYFLATDIEIDVSLWTGMHELFHRQSYVIYGPNLCMTVPGHFSY